MKLNGLVRAVARATVSILWHTLLIIYLQFVHHDDHCWHDASGIDPSHCGIDEAAAACSALLTVMLVGEVVIDDMIFVMPYIIKYFYCTLAVYFIMQLLYALLLTFWTY